MSFKAYIVDIETNGLLPPQLEKTIVSEIHCIVLRNQKGVTKVFIDPAKAKQAKWKADGTLEDAANICAAADVLIGHNAQEFDIGILLKFFPNNMREWKDCWTRKKHGKLVRDTQIMARLIWPDIKPYDFALKGKLPGRLKGAHSLEAWGYRLGEKKGEYGKQTDWSQIDHEMVSYCVQDVAVTAKLFRRLTGRLKTWPNGGVIAERLEHEFAECISEQMRNGVHYDRVAHDKLYKKICTERDKQREFIRTSCPPWEEQLKTKVKITPFNPNSRMQMEKFLRQRYDWVPQENEMTPTGRAEMNEAVLSHPRMSEYKEAEWFHRYLYLQSRAAEIEEGKQSYLKHYNEDTGCVHGYVNHNGAVTSRCTHSKPNKANVVAIDKEYGPETRALFCTPGADWHFLGWDAKGIEFRGLAHYTVPYDDGELIDIVLNGDIHWKNTQALLHVLGHPEFIGAVYDSTNKTMVECRDFAKTFIYGYMYGARDPRLGSIIQPKASERKRRSIGKSLRSVFEKNIPALPLLQADIIEEARKNHKKIVGLDGRMLDIRSDHSALNTKLQGFGAIVIKQASVLVREWAGERWTYGKDFAQVLHVHDEAQSQVKIAIAEEYAQLACKAVEETGKMFGVLCPLGADTKIGTNWAETH